MENTEIIGLIVGICLGLCAAIMISILVYLQVREIKHDKEWLNISEGLKIKKIHYSYDVTDTSTGGTSGFMYNGMGYIGPTIVKTKYTTERIIKIGDKRELSYINAVGVRHFYETIITDISINGDQIMLHCKKGTDVLYLAAMKHLIITFDNKTTYQYK